MDGQSFKASEDEADRPFLTKLLFLYIYIHMYVSDLAWVYVDVGMYVYAYSCLHTDTLV